MCPGPMRGGLPSVKNKLTPASFVCLIELMLLGLISLLLAQWANWISQICVNSSLFSSKFYLCSEQDFDMTGNVVSERSFTFLNETDVPPKGINALSSHQCGEVVCFTVIYINL